MPLHRTSAARPLPVGFAPKSAAFLQLEAATLRTRSALVVSHDLGGLLRIDTLQVCCTLHPVLGFARFPVRFPARPEGLAVPFPFPQAPYPPKRSPHLQPHRVTATVASAPFHLLSACHSSVLPRRHCSFPTCRRPRGLAPQTSPLPHSALPPSPARCSLGLFPTRVHYTLASLPLDSCPASGEAGPFTST